MEALWDGDIGTALVVARLRGSMILKTLLQNSVSNFSVFIVKLSTALVMTPVIIKALGNYDYGLWEVVITITGYMGMLDMGIRPAVVRYVANFDAKSDRSSLDQLFTSALLFNASLGVLSFIGLLVWALYSPSILQASTNNIQRYVLFFSIVGFQLLLEFPGYISECFLMGQQHYLMRNSVILINTLVGNSILFFLLRRGYGLICLAFVNSCGIVLKYIIYYWLLRLNRFGGYRFNPSKASMGSIRKTLGLGFKVWVQSVSGMVTEKASSPIIAVLLGAAMVPFFSIPAALLGYIRRLSLTITDVFMPMFSHLDSRGLDDEAKAVYLSCSKYIMGLSYPLIVGVCILGKPFLSLWVGEEYAYNSTKILYLLGCAYLVLFINPLQQRYLVAVNKVAFLAKIRLFGALLSLISLFALVSYLGITGAAASLLITFLFCEPLVLNYVCIHLGISVRRYIAQVLIPVSIPTLLLLTVLFVISRTFKLHSYSVILFWTAISGCIYTLTFLGVSLNSKERRVILKAVPSRFMEFVVSKL